MLAALRIRDFRFLWIGQLLSNLGNWLLVVAVPFYVFDLTGSALATGTSFVVETLPAVFLAPICGVFTDRWERRRTMLVADCIRAVCVLTLLQLHRPDQLWILYLAVFAENAAGQLFRPARQAILPEIVGRHELLVSANSLNSVMDGVVRLVGAPTGGALYVTLGARGIFLIDALSYVVSAGFLALLGTRASPIRDLPSQVGVIKSVLLDLGQGLWHFWTRLNLRGLFIVSVAFYMANGALTALLVPFVSRNLHGNSHDLGLLLSALGAGYLLGAPMSKWLVQRLHLRVLVSMSLTGVAICFLLLFNLRFFALNVAAIAAAGIPAATFLVATQTQVQRLTPDQLLGRVSGAFLTAEMGATVVGAFLSSSLSSVASLAVILNAASIGVLVAAIVALFLLPAPVAALTPTKAKSTSHKRSFA